MTKITGYLSRPPSTFMSQTKRYANQAFIKQKQAAIVY